MELVARGIPFIILQPESRLPESDPAYMESYIPVPRRHVEWQPDQHDYRAYEHHRTRVLMLPRARAALTEGGILWRLARDADVIPTAAVFTNSSQATTYRPDVARLSDLCADRLSTRDVNILCGVVDVEHGT